MTIAHDGCVKIREVESSGSPQDKYQVSNFLLILLLHQGEQRLLPEPDQ
jgi:hypothetical protein